ncbi:MAG: N-6 DNA methylase [Deltaproteobacteria bacterium]|nr:N-6 DNA methylase [Deltaproteobacteria bacterium]
MSINIENSKIALSILLKLSQSMPISSKALWVSRISHIYGDMKGQRSVDLTNLCKIIGLRNSSSIAIDIVVALETYFYLICNIIAYSSFHKDPSGFLRQIHSYPLQHFRSFLDGVINGALFEEEGLYGCKFAFDFDWILEGCSDANLLSLRDSVSALSKVWEQDHLLIKGHDPFQIIHHSIFPKNLLHITGQFYTPEWLAELLLNDIDWTPDKRLLDPFCGSGVFLIYALERTRKLGVTVTDALPNIFGIDLNPVACAAARANIALYIGRQKRKLDSQVNLNVISADSLAPAITKGHNIAAPLGFWNSTIHIDGETVNLPDFDSGATTSRILERLSAYGLKLNNWIKDSQTPTKGCTSDTLSARDRRIWEQFFIYAIMPADVILTNPPWVGWEYISRPYRETITDAWRLYDLFKVKGLDAAFLKEDISTLALMAAWDFFLADKGKSAVVLRPAAMLSDLAARGLRRLSLADKGTPLKLEHVRTFSNLRVFPEANTEVATWQIQKGHRTVFPVKVTDWNKNSKRWNPDTFMGTEEIASLICSTQKQAVRTDPQNIESRWLIADSETIDNLAPLQGTNDYVPRMGVFTGGANAIFYLEHIKPGTTKDVSLYRNIVERAKKPVPSREISIEHDVVFSVLRGKDIQMWHSKPVVYLLCPHTRDTRMYPLEEPQLKSSYPLAYGYLLSMQNVLSERKGFAGWEKDVLKKYYYTLQRIGEYTFAPYKVCWKYIASEFTVCVINGDNYSKPILPNDKVMFIPFESLEAAYFLCGILSSTLIRKYVNSSASKRQISTNIIKSLALPNFDKMDKKHMRISSLCLRGHLATEFNDADQLNSIREELDHQVFSLFGI